MKMRFFKIIVFFMLIYSFCSLQCSFSKEFSFIPNDIQKGEFFGHAVSIYGNFAIIGASRHDGSVIGSQCGAVYFYQKTQNTWAQSQKITSIVNNQRVWFGWSVSISEKIAIVGSRYDKDKGDDSGAAYIFEYEEESNKWIFVKKIYASDTEESDNFGYAVSVSDNNFILISAIGSKENGIYSGAVYFFEKKGDQWQETQKISAFDGKQYDMFGISVSTSNSSAIVGSYQSDDCAGESSGSAYFYERNENSWNLLQKKCASDADLDDHFGCSVSIDGKYAVVGAYANQDNGKLSGSAYVFKHENDSWSETQKINAFDGKEGDRFGSAVAINDKNLIIGAYSYNSYSKTATGKTYLYKMINNEWEYQTSIIPSDIEEYDIFGSAVAISKTDIIIGAHGKDDSSGKAYIYSDVFNEFAISGYINNIKGEPIPNARIESSTKQTSISGDPGFFDLNVPYDFCGSISIFINDYISPSNVKQYTNVRNDISNERYIIDQYSISGFISDTQNNPISGVQIHFSNGGGEAISNINGYFTHEVYKGWSGTINPSGRGYQFTPSYIALDNISNHYSDQLFKGSKLSISGYVIDEIGNPVESVKMSLDKPNNINVTTDQYGFYILEIDKDWSGYISPEKDSCTFSPSNISYTSVSINFTNQNFNCILTTPTFEVSSDILNLTSKSGFSYITISSNELPFNKYSASIDQDSWLTISKLESAVLIIHQENDQYSDRIATLTISAGNQSKSIQLIQKSKTLELDWNVDISRFQFQGNITAIVKDRDGIIIQSDKDILAAFVGDECRGKAFLSPVSDGKRFFLQVWSNKLSETMTFKYFDSNQQLVFDYLKPTIEFSPDIEMGNISSPFELTLLGNKVFPDANDDGTVDLFDVIYVLQYLSNTNYQKEINGEGK